jgi:hypothetical protein
MLDGCLRTARRMGRKIDPLPCDIVNVRPVAKRKTSIESVLEIRKVPADVIDEVV